MIQTALYEAPIEESPFDAEAAMVAAQEGTTTAFSELYAHLAPAIHAHFMRLSGGNEALAEDYTQDTFIRAFQSIHVYKTKNVKAWLYQIATNRYIDGYRRQQRINIDFADPWDEGSQTIYETPYNNVELLEDQVATRLDLESYVKKVHGSMLPMFAQTLCAVGELGLPYEEAATALDTKVGTIRSRLNRARKLAKRLPLPPGYERHTVSFESVQNPDGAGGDERDDDE